MKSKDQKLINNSEIKSEVSKRDDDLEEAVQYHFRTLTILFYVYFFFIYFPTFSLGLSYRWICGQWPLHKIKLKAGKAV